MLDEPAGKVLAAFHNNQTAVSGWFSVLALPGALMAPIAIGVGRLSSKPASEVNASAGTDRVVVYSSN